AAHADRVDRRMADGPVHDVEVVDVLLDDMVAAQPGEVVPVPKLVDHVAPIRLSLVSPDSALVPVATAAGNVAEFASSDLSHHFQITRLVAALRAGDDA